MPRCITFKRKIFCLKSQDKEISMTNPEIIKKNNLKVLENSKPSWISCQNNTSRQTLQDSMHFSTI